MQIIKKIWVLVAIICLGCSAEATEGCVIRAAIDIGSGGPKLTVAEVDTVSNKIIKVVHTEQYVVNFYDSIQADNRLSEAIMSKGIDAIKSALGTASIWAAESSKGIATAAFRKAVNGEEYAQAIYEETGLTVHIIDSQLEGILAFEAAKDLVNIPSEHLVVWDVGGGSTQWVAKHGEEYILDYWNEGAGAFRNYIIETVQGHSFQEVKTPNPLASDDILKGLEAAYVDSQRMGPLFREKLKDTQTVVVGVGGAMSGLSQCIMKGQNAYTIDELAQRVEEIAGLTDEDFGGRYPSVEGSSAILVLGYMQGLEISHLQTVDVNNAHGALVYEPFWQKLTQE